MDKLPLGVAVKILPVSIVPCAAKEIMKQLTVFLPVSEMAGAHIRKETRRKRRKGRGVSRVMGCSPALGSVFPPQNEDVVMATQV